MLLPKVDGLSFVRGRQPAASQEDIANSRVSQQASTFPRSNTRSFQGCLREESKPAMLPESAARSSRGENHRSPAGVRSFRKLPPRIPAMNPPTSIHRRLSWRKVIRPRLLNENTAKSRIRTPNPTLITLSGAQVSRTSPSGIPKIVDNTSHPALRQWMWRQSCATTTAAIVMDTSTAKGAATCIGMKKASRGTAISASPNPNAERITVATNTIRRTSRMVA